MYDPILRGGANSQGQPIPNLESTKLKEGEGDPRTTREFSGGRTLGMSVFPLLAPNGEEGSKNGKVDQEVGLKPQQTRKKGEQLGGAHSLLGPYQTELSSGPTNIHNPNMLFSRVVLFCCCFSTRWILLLEDELVCVRRVFQFPIWCVESQCWAWPWVAYDAGLAENCLVVWSSLFLARSWEFYSLFTGVWAAEVLMNRGVFI
ncbi:hypothetical protein U1Q18_038475 [Sarracenia purpurea var. burkii]